MDLSIVKGSINEIYAKWTNFNWNTWEIHENSKKC